MGYSGAGLIQLMRIDQFILDRDYLWFIIIIIIGVGQECNTGLNCYPIILMVYYILQKVTTLRKGLFRHYLL